MAKTPKLKPFLKLKVGLTPKGLKSATLSRKDIPGMNPAEEDTLRTAAFLVTGGHYNRAEARKSDVQIAAIGYEAKLPGDELEVCVRYLLQKGYLETRG